MGYDPNKSTWLNPNIEYLFNDEIYEYDIQDAGFTLIKQFKLLPDDKIRELELMGKGQERHIAVGKLQRNDKEFTKALMNKFAEIRTIFIGANQLKDDRIISVKKDAIYTIGTCEKIKFGNIIFAEKNKYSSYIRFSEIQNLEIYYSNMGIDIKGMSDRAVNRHRLYLLDFLRKIISMIEKHDPRSKRFIKNFISEYKSTSLDEEYYLEFNNMSKDLNALFNYQNLIIPIVQIILKEIE